MKKPKPKAKPKERQTTPEVEKLIKHGEELQEKGELAHARQAFDRALELATAPRMRMRAFMGRADVRDDQDDFDGAVEDYSEAIKLEPDDPFLYYLRGIVQQAREDWPAARADFDAAIARDATCPEFFEVRGMVRFNLQDWQGARADFSKAIADNPEVEPRFFRFRGEAAALAGDFDGAIQDFSRAIEGDGADARALMQRAKAEEARGDLQAALADVEQVMVLMPGNCMLEEHRDRLLGLTKKGARGARGPK